MMKFVLAAAIALAAATAVPATAQDVPRTYLDSTGKADQWSGGVRMVPIKTPKGGFNVWTKRVGNNPKLAVLLLHGGPGATHDYLEPFDSFLPREGIEYIYYDQLGSGRSDKPTDTDLWTLDRFVDEVEQVRVALGLTKDNFCVLGHSWGGILAIEYALKYPANLKCMVVSNMMASIPAYNAYAQKTLMPAMDQKLLAEVKAIEAKGDTANPRYMEILGPLHYEQHILRRPAAEWPEPLNHSFAQLNTQLYTLMQGPSELGASGRLVNWDRFADLAKITTPTLVIGARYDTMDPAYMAAMAKKLPNGQFALMPEGSHMAMYDDQQRYFAALTAFLKARE
jgi:proline iminopeptidase